MFTDDFEISNAVWGRQKTTFFINKETGESFEGASHIDNTGLFSTNRYAQVSAVLIFSVGVGSVGCPKYWFIHNPFAKFPLNAEEFSLKSHFFDGIRLVENAESRTVNEILGIPCRWST